MSTIAPQDEATARTLLNMHLVALYREDKARDLADTTKALQFITELSAHDPRLSRFLQETHVAVAWLGEYLQESLKELNLAASRKLVPMLVPVPPNLEQTLGYTGNQESIFTSVPRDAQYLGFCWSAGHVYWEDGLGGQTDNWTGYLTWYHHWLAGGSIGPYRDKLGSDDGDPATHEWLLDRWTRLIFITPREAAPAIYAPVR